MTTDQTTDKQAEEENQLTAALKGLFSKLGARSIKHHCAIEMQNIKMANVLSSDLADYLMDRFDVPGLACGITFAALRKIADQNDMSPQLLGALKELVADLSADLDKLEKANPQGEKQDAAEPKVETKAEAAAAADTEKVDAES